MLFGVEDVITERFPHRPTKTFGQDWNDALYALVGPDEQMQSRVDAVLDEVSAGP